MKESDNKVNARLDRDVFEELKKIQSENDLRSISAAIRFVLKR